jgi:hypothetical protein
VAEPGFVDHDIEASEELASLGDRRGRGILTCDVALICDVARSSSTGPVHYSPSASARAEEN